MEISRNLKNIRIDVGTSFVNIPTEIWWQLSEQGNDIAKEIDADQAEGEENADKISCWHCAKEIPRGEQHIRMAFREQCYYLRKQKLAAMERLEEWKKKNNLRIMLYDARLETGWNEVVRGDTCCSVFEAINNIEKEK